MNQQSSKVKWNDECAYFIVKWLTLPGFNRSEKILLF